MELESVNILKNTINTAVQQAFNNYQQKVWLSLKDGAFYAVLVITRSSNLEKWG